MAVVSWALLPEDSPYPGIRRRRFDGRGFTLVRYEFAPGASFPLHHHPEEQLVLVEAGEVIMRSGDAEMHLRAGDACWTPPHEVHGITAGASGAVFVNLIVPRREHAPRVVGDSAD